MLDLFFRCSGCGEPASIGLFPLCELCAASLYPAPALCPKCASPVCSENPECLRPWVSDFEEAGIVSFTSVYLLLEPTHRVLKRWKTTHGPSFDRIVLAPIREKTFSWSRDKVRSIIPIPQTIDRAWRLNGSPALKIAKKLSDETRIPLTPVLRCKSSPQKRQAERNAVSRFENRMGFEASPEALPPEGSQVILVDDFMTTGHTLRRAAEALSVGRRIQVHIFCLGVRPFRIQG